MLRFGVGAIIAGEKIENMKRSHHSLTEFFGSLRERFRRPLGNPDSDEVRYLSYANRTDGLGERLCTILNAILLSKLLGYDFKFTWTPAVWNPMYRKSDASSEEHIHTALDFPVQEIFAKQFMAKHLLSERPSGTFRDFRQNNTSVDEVREWEKVEGYLGIVPVQGDLRRTASAIAGESFPPSYSEVFQEVKFSRRYESIRRMASRVDLPEDFTAIHLRSGDMVYGEPRKWGLWLNKVMPPSVAQRIVEDELANGHDVVVFAQNGSVASAIASSPNANSVDLYIDRLDLGGHERAFLEMLVMSRSSKIVGGASGFARFASLVGEVDIISPSALFSRDESRDIITKDLEAYPTKYDAFTRAHSWWQAFYYSRSSLTLDQAKYLLSQAIDADPRNPLYAIVLSSRLFSAGESASADSVVERALREEGTSSVPGTEFADILIYRHPKNDFSCKEYFPGFLAASSHSDLAAQCAEIIAKSSS